MTTKTDAENTPYEDNLEVSVLQGKDYSIHEARDEKRLQRRATHRAERIGEILVVTPDKVRRVPFSVVLSPDDTLMILSFLPDESTILDRFDTKGKYLGEVARFRSGRGRSELRSPAGVAMDEGGNFYIPDADRNRILKFDPKGRFLQEFGEEGMAEGQILGPRDVEIGPDGRILVADTENHRIQVWNADGSFEAVFGAEVSEDDESPYLPKGAGPGEFFRPLGVTFDNEGKILVADTNNHRIQRLSVTNGFELQFGREGLEAGALSYPIDVRIDARGRAVVADRAGMRVQWFDLQGKLEIALALDAALAEGAAVADVDVDDEGVVYIPEGPTSRVYMVKAGEALP
jgi:DNA-binding beta-propeller fold protein YncE